MTQLTDGKLPATRQRPHIAQIPVFAFAAIFVVAVAAAIVGMVPDNLGGALALAVILGVGLNWIGDQIPVLRDLGFGTILAVLLPAILIQVGLFPESVREIEANFFSGYDFTSFLVPGLLVGSVLAMPRHVLVQAGVRFIVPLFVTLIVTMGVVGGVGALIGYGFIETILFVVGPIMGSGISAGAVPLSQIYANITGGDPSDHLTTLTASVMIANIGTILIAAVLGGMSRRNPDKPFAGFSGRGTDLLRKGGSTEEQETERTSTKYPDLLTGLLITGGVYLFAQFGGHFVPAVHPYVWMIVTCLVLKLARLTPQSLEDGAGSWAAFMGKVMVPAVLAAISMGVLNLGDVLALMSDPVYLFLCLLTCIVAFLCGGLMTYLFGFFFVEGSIMCGLGMADMGGTGDVAVLSAARKMHLMPFMTISNRVGGAATMVVCSLLATVLFA